MQLKGLSSEWMNLYCVHLVSMTSFLRPSYRVHARNAIGSFFSSSVTTSFIFHPRFTLFEMSFNFLIWFELTDFICLTGVSRIAAIVVLRTMVHFSVPFNLETSFSDNLSYPSIRFFFTGSLLCIPNINGFGDIIIIN